MIYLYSSQDTDEDSQLAIWRQADCFRFRFPEIATYDLTPSAIRCYPVPTVLPEVLTNFLLSTVLCIWLELRGVPALHASAVVVNGRVVGFLSHSRNGKSTLATSLVKAGYPLITDDIVAVKRGGNTFECLPAYARIRLWPDEATHFLGHFQDLELVHPETTKRWISVGDEGFGTFCDVPKPLACVYVPERQVTEIGNEIRIAPVSPRDAVIELIRYSFESNLVEAMGLSQQRLEFFTSMAQQVPMRRLVYPSGFQYLPRVRDAILRDLQNLG